MEAQTLTVACRPAGKGWSCQVTVGRDANATTHEVGLTAADLARLAPTAQDPTALVTESFRFMLEREPREAILRQFDLPVIGRYFPEYAVEIARRLDGGR